MNTYNSLLQEPHMARLPLIRNCIFCVTAALLVIITGCAGERYTGPIDPTRHQWLTGKKIFVDPGHGGTGEKDRFRTGPGGITEEEINLTVGLILQDMLKKSGALVKMSRWRDVDVSLNDRVDMAVEFEPDILVSLHHNGTARRCDDVNYPSVLIWGSPEIKPASYDFATLLLDELETITGKKGSVLSDFSVFHETGTRILRKTAQLCPGVIGEAGFFSHEDQAKLLDDKLYLQREAEAYFTALSKYFQWGPPTAEIILSCEMEKNGILYHELSEENPHIDIRVISGNENRGIVDKSLNVTLDSIPVRVQKIDTDLFRVMYGTKLYPGGHLLRFHFKNLRHQSSMILKFPFTVTIHQGDYDRLIVRGCRMVKKWKTAREGLKMLLAALSMGQTDPDAVKIVDHIIQGFLMIGEPGIAGYFKKKLVFFYPQSPEGKKYKSHVMRSSSYRFPVEFHGKAVPFKIKPQIHEQNRTTRVQVPCPWH